MQLKDTGGSDFAITPAGVHVAVCYQVIDLGIKHNPRFDNYQRKLRIAWELPNEHMEDGRPFSVASTYTASLGSKANLRRDLEAWRGRPFTEDELGGFNPQRMMGAACQISVVHNESNGNTYANVNSIMPLPKGMDKPTPTNDVLYFSWDDTREKYHELPDWVKQKAMGEDPAAFVEPENEFNSAVDEARQQSQPQQSNDHPQYDDDFDDDIPF